jgi:hypothetical protein
MRRMIRRSHSENPSKSKLFNMKEVTMINRKNLLHLLLLVTNRLRPNNSSKIILLIIGIREPKVD